MLRPYVFCASNLSFSLTPSDFCTSTLSFSLRSCGFALEAARRFCLDLAIVAFHFRFDLVILDLSIFGPVARHLVLTSRFLS